MFRMIGMMVCCAMVGCAPPESMDGTGVGGSADVEDVGEAPAAAVIVKQVPGIWVHPESAHWSTYHQRWLVTNTLIGSHDLKAFDGAGWLGHVTRAGTALFPLDTGGMGDSSNWLHLDTAWYSQWGGDAVPSSPHGVLGNPLGLTSNPVTGTIYVVEAGRLDPAGVPDLDAGLPSVTVLDKDGAFQRRVFLPGVVTPNDVVWAQTSGATAGTGKLYLTDSGFGGLAKVMVVEGPDSASASVSTFVSLANYPGANAVALDPSHNSGGGARPHLVISTLGSDLSGTNPNGKVLTIDLTSKVVKGVTLTGAGAPAKLFADTMAIRDAGGIYPTKRWVVASLLERKLYDINPVTGATTLYADLSGTIPQLGGGSCTPRSGTAPSQCTWASFGWSNVVMTQ